MYENSFFQLLFSEVDNCEEWKVSYCVMSIIIDRSTAEEIITAHWCYYPRDLSSLDYDRDMECELLIHANTYSFIYVQSHLNYDNYLNYDITFISEYIGSHSG